MDVDELKRVTASLNALYNDKVKANKPIKGRKKAANKAKLHLGKESVSRKLSLDYCNVSSMHTIAHHNSIISSRSESSYSRNIFNILELSIVI